MSSRLGVMPVAFALSYNSSSLAAFFFEQISTGGEVVVF
jgi:hypothetical protein